MYIFEYVKIQTLWIYCYFLTKRNFTDNLLGDNIEGQFHPGWGMQKRKWNKNQSIVICLIIWDSFPIFSKRNAGIWWSHFFGGTKSQRRRLSLKLQSRSSHQVCHLLTYMKDSPEEKRTIQRRGYFFLGISVRLG